MDDTTSRALNNRLKKDGLLCKQLLSSFSKQQHSPQMQEFIAGGKISAISSKCSLLEAAKQMACHRLSTLIVIDGEGQMSGLLGHSEMRRALANSMNPKTNKVVQVMQGVPVSVQGGVKTSTAVELMVQNKVQLLPMLEGDEIVGIIELGQLLQDTFFENECVIDLLNTLSDAPVIVAVEPKCTIMELAILLESEQSNAALVIDNGRMVGVISMPDIVLRVMASGLDARSTSVVRVMTPGMGTVTTEHRLADIRDKMLIGSSGIDDERTGKTSAKSDNNKKDMPINHTQSYVPVMDSADGSIVAIMDVFHLAAFVVNRANGKDASSLLKEAQLAKSSSFNALGWEPPSRKGDDIGGMSGLQRCDSRDQLSETAEFDLDDDISQTSDIGNEPKFVLKGTSARESKEVGGTNSVHSVDQPRKIESEPSLNGATETSSESNREIATTESKGVPSIPTSDKDSNASAVTKRRFNLLTAGTIVIAGVLTGLWVYKRIHQSKAAQ